MLDQVEHDEERRLPSNRRNIDPCVIAPIQILVDLIYRTANRLTCARIRVDRISINRRIAFIFGNITATLTAGSQTMGNDTPALSIACKIASLACSFSQRISVNTSRITILHIIAGWARDNRTDTTARLRGKRKSIVIAEMNIAIAV